MSLAPDDILCLVGLRCSGKTTVGRVLGARLAWPFADLDQVLAARWAERHRGGGNGVPHAGELLIRIGEPAFRALEAECLAVLLEQGGPLVLATGGGCVETAASREGLLTRARCVWLEVELPELQRRLAASDDPRPALEGDDPAADLERLAGRRAPLYAEVVRARVVADGLAPERVAEAVLRALERAGA